MWTRATTEELVKWRNYLNSSDAIDSNDVLMFVQESMVALLDEVLEHRKIYCPQDERFGSYEYVEIDKDEQ